MKGLGYSANVGQVEGEYCPGQYSINIDGLYKVMGVGQRIVKGAAHIGGVLVVNDHFSVRTVLEDVYEKLEIQWNPETVGSLSQQVLLGEETNIQTIRDAVISVFESEFDMKRDELPKNVIEFSQSFEKFHLIER